MSDVPTCGNRFRAKPELTAAIEDQGRRYVWLADRVGISTPLLSLALSGKRTVSHDVAARIASELAVSFATVFEEAIPTAAE